MPYKKFIFIIFLVCLSFLAGTLGFYHIEKWSFIDSLYMTFITLTTVGFGEVHPLSENGRIFTIFLLVFGLGIVTYSISEFMNFIIVFDLKKYKRSKSMNSISKFENHTIVCGYGRMGAVVCEELAQNKTKFVVIEKDAELIKELEKTDYHWIDGDAASEDVLDKAVVSKANVLISMVDSDADALYISLVSRSMNDKLFIICRANEETAKNRILRAGANRVVLPTRMTALRVAECVLNPAVEDFLDISGVKERKGDRIQLADLFVTEGSNLVGKTLEERGQEMKNLIIVGVRKSDKSFLFKPPADYVFKTGDCLIAMGSTAAYENAKNHFNLDSVTPF